MCYLVRQNAAEAEHGALAPPPPGSERMRSRWAGAAAATLIGGLALAGLFSPSRTAPLSVPDQVAAAPVATRTGAVSERVVIEQTALPAGDDVPTAPDASRAGIGGCHHGL